MPIKVSCSNCGGMLHAPDDAGGKRGRCPTCGNILPIPPLDAARASAASLPDPPAGKGGRSPSFGDFAVGPQVGPPPGGADPVRSSIPFADAPKPVRESVPSIGEKAPRRATDPFARQGPAAMPGGASDGLVKAWKRAKAGLGWVSFATFLFLIPALALPGMLVADFFVHQAERNTVQTKIDEKNVDLKKIEGDVAKSQADKQRESGPLKEQIKQLQSEKDKFRLLPDGEFPGLNGVPYSIAVPVLVAAVPILLGLMCLAVGRLGVSNAPGRSFAKGLALLSALAALTTLGGLVAVAFPSVALLLGNKQGGDDAGLVLQFLGKDDPSGLIQRFGALAAVAGLILGEIWFASAVGRVGTALGDGRTAGRATRYLMLFGLVIGGYIVSAAVVPTAFGFGSSAPGYAAEANEVIVKQVWVPHVAPQFDHLGEFKPLLKPGLFLLGGLFLGFVYLRMVGAARGAIREWLENNAGGR